MRISKILNNLLNNLITNRSIISRSTINKLRINKEIINKKIINKFIKLNKDYTKKYCSSLNINFNKNNKNSKNHNNYNNSEKIIQVKDLNFSYSNEINIFDDVSFDILKGDLIAIIGPNGSGKSTLIKLLTGIIESDSNSIKINGKISYIPQKFNQDSNFPAKVSELIELECCICERSLGILKSLGILDLKDKQFKDLSGGQQQRVLIAVSLLSNPDILILDEPTIGIDTKTQDEFYKILKKLNKENNLTILFVTHDTSMISNYFSKILCVFNGKITIDDAKNTHSILHSIYGNKFYEIKHNHLENNKDNNYILKNKNEKKMKKNSNMRVEK